MTLTTEQLNLARDRLYRNIVDYFVGRQGILALYLQGSVAEDAADGFSDLDFRVVVEPEAYQQYIADRFNVPKQWGDWLYNEWAGSSWICVSHFKPFNKVDLLYFRSEQLQPSPWFLLPTKVIFDPRGLIARVVRASEQQFDLLTIEEVERLVGKGLAYSEEVYRRAMRHELFYAQSLLDSLRHNLIQFDDYLHQDFVSSGFGSPSHFEQRGSKALVEVLKLSYPPLDRQSILQALGILLRHYRTQVEQLHTILPLERSLETDLSWIDTLYRIRANEPPNATSQH